MGKRAQLQIILEALIDSANVYFQPPETFKMSYPCIMYTRNAIETKFADDIPYTNQIRYRITVIDKDPDSAIPEKIAKLPMCIFDRHYTSNNFNHDVYNMYY